MGDTMAGYPCARGVEITDTCFTGGKNAILPTLKRSISAIVRCDGAWEQFYIGIASGPDYWIALSRRVDAYKLNCGVRRMYLIYESRSQQNVRFVETELERYYTTLRPADTLNRRGGGAGRTGFGPRYYLYLAVVPHAG
jgi:hypothetical protein